MKNKLTTAIFFNHCFDKRRFQNFLYWFFKKSYFGQFRSQPPKRKLLKFLERLKFLGFHSATQAGFSISIDDLKIPSSKSEILLTAENLVLEADLQLISGNLTTIERYQRIIEIWNRTSEELKYQVLQSFKISDFLNPVYLMAFSGARGNISQIRQLVGMRGLMADPQGQLIDFPIRSNFREGLTLTEYLISCSGARKGIVDTALRTAASGYLTRRLVDVAHHVIVHQMDCQRLATRTPQQEGGGVGIWIEDLYDQQKKILPLQQRLIGRVLAETIISLSETSNFAQTPALPQRKNALIIGQKNHEISKMTSQKICKYRKRVFIRSPLTCQSSKFICQLCYGWNLSEGQFVSVGEAVGVLAAQSIGEPGTQLTMRTFHTGGVFTGILMDQTYAPFSGMAHYHFPCNGLLIRTLQGKIAYLSKNNGILIISQGQKTSPSRRFQNQRALAFGFILKNRPVSPGRPTFKKAGTKSLEIKIQKGSALLNLNSLKYKLQQKRKNLARLLRRGSSPLLRRRVSPSAKDGPLPTRASPSNYQTLFYQLKKIKGQFQELGLRSTRQAPKGGVKVRQTGSPTRTPTRGLVAPGRGQWKLPKQIQFIFQNFTILYVRQNEKVLKKQLIAELPFFENEKSLENEQEILSNESGEIYFWDIVFLEKTISDFKTEALAFKKNFVQDLGGFWILFGRSFQHILLGLRPFFKKFDLIDQKVPFSQIQIESNYFLNTEALALANSQFLQFEQIFLSSFLKKTNHKGRIFKQQMATKAINNFSTPLKMASPSNSDEYTLILKRGFGTFQMGLIFFKKWGYLRMTWASLKAGSGGSPPPKIGPAAFTEGSAPRESLSWSQITKNNNPKQQKITLLTGGDPAPVPNLCNWRRIAPRPPFNFIQKIQIFNGIDPIWTYFWNKKKVFWNDRPKFQSQKFETWMMGLQGQSKYITEALAFGAPRRGADFIKISKLKLQIHFLKQKDFCFKFKGLTRIPYIQNSYFRYHGDPIFLAKAQSQKQKINFFLSDTGLILKKAKKNFCEFQWGSPSGSQFFKKYKPYFVNQNQVQSPGSFSARTFLAKSENFFLNVNPGNRSAILLVNRQGIFQSFERKVLKNRLDSFVTSQIQKVVCWSDGKARVPIWKGKAFFPPRWIAKVQDFRQIQDEASFRIGTQIFYKNKTKSICKIQKSFCQWPLGKSFRLKIRQWLAQTGSLFWLVLKDSFFPPQLFKKKNNNLEPQGVVGHEAAEGLPKEIVYYWSLCTPKNPLGHFDPKLYFWPRPKIQSILCHLFLKQSRIFQNLPENWARQITNIQPKIIHWKNLPNQKYIFILNFLTHFDSAKYIKQKNLKKITGMTPEDQRDFDLSLGPSPAALGLWHTEGGLSPKEKDGTRAPSALRRQTSGQLHQNGASPSYYPSYPSQVFRQHSKMEDFAEKIQRSKKRTFQQNPVCNNLQWIVEAFWRQKSKNHTSPFRRPTTKNLLNLGFVPKLGFSHPQMTVRLKLHFPIKSYNFWKIQQRQEILRYQKFKMGFYSFIRIFFSFAHWGEDLNSPFGHHHWKGGLRPRGGQLGLGASFPGRKPSYQKLLLTNAIYKNNWAFAFVWPRVRVADPILQFHLRAKLQFFKTLNIRRIRQKSSYICSIFRQKMPKIFSINEQKRIFIDWALANKKIGASPSLFFIQKLSAPMNWPNHTSPRPGPKISHESATQKTLWPSRRGRGPDVGWVPTGFAFGSAQDVPQDPEKDKDTGTLGFLLAPQVLTSIGKGFRLTGQRSRKFNKKRLRSLGRGPVKEIPYPLKTFPLTNFLNDHQQIFYEKFKKNFQNIHLNSMEGLPVTNLLELGASPALEDQCIRWTFFGDCTIILEKNIYSTYFKNLSLLTEGPMGFSHKNWASPSAKRASIQGLPARRKPPADRYQRKQKPQNLLGITYPSIQKVLISTADQRGQNFLQEFYHMELGAKLDKSIWANKKYLFDQILPRSLVRSESSILKLGFSQLQKWILDNYFDSYLLIIKNFFLLKNFENRFFQSLPKKPIYNQFYYHDNKIETEWISEYTQQVAVKKYKLQEIRQYTISSLGEAQGHHSEVKRISSEFSKAKAQFIEKFNNSDFLKNLNLANKEGGEAVASKNEFNVRDADPWVLVGGEAAAPRTDPVELPIHLYNFYIEYISKKSSRFKSALDFEKIYMKTWLNRLKNFQKYSRRYLKSPILSGGRSSSGASEQAGEGLARQVRIPSLRYKKYWRKTIFFFQKLGTGSGSLPDKKKQYCFVLKWLKPFDHFYSIGFAQDFFSWQNRKSFRIPFFGSGEVWAFTGDFSQRSALANVNLHSRIGSAKRTKIVQKPLFLKTAFKTYPIFKTLLSIYFNNPRWSLQTLRRRDSTMDSTVVLNPVHPYKSKTSFRRSRFHSLFNFMSLQIEYLAGGDPAPVQNLWLKAIPLLDQKLEIFLVSVFPIRAQTRSLRPHLTKAQLYSRPSDLKNKIKMIRSSVPGEFGPRSRFYGSGRSRSVEAGPKAKASVHALGGKAGLVPFPRQRADKAAIRLGSGLRTKARPTESAASPLTPFVGQTFGMLYNQTHSLKIYIIKTKRLNFLTQKYLRVETVKASEHFVQNRGFHLTNLLHLSKGKAAQQFRRLPFGQNGRNRQAATRTQFQIIKRYSKRSGTPSTQAKPNLLYSSEIQIFIRFFLPFYSGEMLASPKAKPSHKQGFLNILFANVSDFFSYRQNYPIDFVRYDVQNKDYPVRLGKKFKYLLFGKIERSVLLAKAQASPKAKPTFFILKNPSTIFDRLQRQNKNKGSMVSNFSFNKYKSDLDGFIGRSPQLQRQQKIKKSQLGLVRSADKTPSGATPGTSPNRSPVGAKQVPRGSQPIVWGNPSERVDGGWQGLAPQQLCLSQKIFYSYKLFPNLNSKIPATTILTKQMKTAGIVSNQLFKKNQKTLVVIGHHPNSCGEAAIQLGSFIRGLAANGRELSENLLAGRDPAPQVHLQGGQFIAKTPHIFLFRKATTHLLNDQSILHVRHGDIILKNQPLFSVFYNQSKTGDIVQGIPKIEEIFEARKKSKYSLHELPIFSKDFLFFEKIIIKYLRSLQKSVVNNIQRIYCGQGIHISDKHIEIIVRQMTSNVFIREPGQTGLLYGEIVALQWISRINVISNQVIYEPVLMGMTKTCLETSSFLSAASFQETTRILGRAALQNQIDFIRGLKQNVILGNLIPIGTGCF